MEEIEKKKGEGREEQARGEERRRKERQRRIDVKAGWEVFPQSGRTSPRSYKGLGKHTGTITSAYRQFIPSI